MNIWKIGFDVEKYMWCVFRETEDMDILSFSGLFNNEKILPDTLPENITFFKRDYEDSGELPPADMMRSSGGDAGIISERAKRMLEAEYSNLFRFFPVCLEEFPEEKYYILNPTEYVFAEDVLDMDNTDINYLRNDKEYFIIYKILRYSFTPKIKGHHFFGLAFNHGKDKMFVWKYCDDEFKRFIEKNNITGLTFEKIFESED